MRTWSLTSPSPLSSGDGVHAVARDQGRQAASAGRRSLIVGDWLGWLNFLGAGRRIYHTLEVAPNTSEFVFGKEARVETGRSGTLAGPRIKRTAAIEDPGQAGLYLDRWNTQGGSDMVSLGRKGVRAGHSTESTEGQGPGTECESGAHDR